MAWTSFAEIEKAALELTSLKVPARSPKTVFQQFQAGHGYEKSEGTGSLSAHPCDFVIGTQSLKFATAGDGVQSHAVVYRAAPACVPSYPNYDTFKVEGLAHVST